MTKASNYQMEFKSRSGSNASLYNKLQAIVANRERHPYHVGQGGRGVSNSELVFKRKPIGISGDNAMERGSGLLESMPEEPSEEGSRGSIDNKINKSSNVATTDNYDPSFVE